MLSLNNITIGADPELFIVDNNGKVISSVGLIPGEKGKPYVAEDMPKGFGLEIDNILAEFNIPPCNREEAFINNIEYMKAYIDRFVKDKNPEYGIECIASRTVEDDQLQSEEAKLFGCDPDYNVYTNRANPRPVAKNTNLRSAGFHIHIGYENNNTSTSVYLVRYLDLYLGIPSILLDKDSSRRELYGRAGSFRLTSYGVEYRVLSSYMMKNPDYLRFVWNQTQKAINACKRSYRLPSAQQVKDAIDHSSKPIAEIIIKYFGVCSMDEIKLLCAESSE